MAKFQLLMLLFSCAVLQATSQNARTDGKIIKDFGLAFDVKNPDIITDTSAELKVIFDVSQSSDDRSVINRHIETAARFLNMHANAGMKLEQLKVAMTIHGGAWQDILNNESYKKLYGIPNPNTKLIKALNEAGVDIIVCGQTAAYRAIKKEDRIPEVKLALSAATALIQYQNNGYQFIKF
jgi:intracellular sulfur oxidation DsrE/DsrF family protein